MFEKHVERPRGDGLRGVPEGREGSEPPEAVAEFEGLEPPSEVKRPASTWRRGVTPVSETGGSVQRRTFLKSLGAGGLATGLAGCPWRTQTPTEPPAGQVAWHGGHIMKELSTHNIIASAGSTERDIVGSFVFTSPKLGDHTVEIPLGETDRLVVTPPEPGQYEISVEMADSWTIDEASCNDPDGGSEIDGNTARIDFDEGDEIVCSWTFEHHSSQ